MAKGTNSFGYPNLHALYSSRFFASIIEAWRPTHRIAFAVTLAGTLTPDVESTRKVVPPDVTAKSALDLTGTSVFNSNMAATFFRDIPGWLAMSGSPRGIETPNAPFNPRTAPSLTCLAKAAVPICLQHVEWWYAPIPSYDSMQAIHTSCKGGV